MKKAKMRYETPEQIERWIDVTKSKQAANAGIIEKMEAAADALWALIRSQEFNKLKHEDQNEYLLNRQKAKNLRSKAEKMRKSHGRFEKRLVRLKRTLAAM